MKLTETKLIELGFTCERPYDKSNDLDGLWVDKNGITLYQEFLPGESFNFATRTKDGEFKSGYEIKDVNQLDKLYEGLGINLFEYENSKIEVGDTVLFNGLILTVLEFTHDGTVCFEHENEELDDFNVQEYNEFAFREVAKKIKKII